MNKFIFLILIFALTSCSDALYPYIDVCAGVVGKKSKQICKEEKIGIAAYGGAMMDSITKITLCFTINRRISLSEARRLIVRAIEEIRDEVNSNIELQPFLEPYPFPSSAMDIGLVVLQRDGGFADYGCAYLGTGGVSSVHQIKGVIYYSSWNPRTEELESYYEEPYEVALAIVRGELPEPEAPCKPID